MDYPPFTLWWCCETPDVTFALDTLLSLYIPATPFILRTAYDLVLEGAGWTIGDPFYNRFGEAFPFTFVDADPPTVPFAIVIYVPPFWDDFYVFSLTPEHTCDALCKQLTFPD